MTKLTPAERAWLGLGLYVLAADVVLWRTNHDTMSIQFGRWLSRKNGRVACLIATGGLVAHLWWGVPLPLQVQARRYLGGKREEPSARRRQPIVYTVDPEIS